MKKQAQIILASVLLMNSAAFAQSVPVEVKNVLSSEQIQALVDKALVVEVKDAEDALKSVDAIIAALKGFQQQAIQNEENPTVALLRSVVTFGGLALQLKKITDKNSGILDDSASLMLAAFLGSIQTVLDGYKQYNRIDLSAVKAVLLENQEQIATALSVDTEQAALIAGIVGDLGKLNADMKTNIDDIKTNIDEGKYLVAGTALIGIVSHYIGKYLPQSIKEKATTKLSDVILNNAAKTKNVSQHGLGSTSFLELISMATGLAGEEPQAMLDQAISNLMTSRSELISEIQKAQNQ